MKMISILLRNKTLIASALLWTIVATFHQLGAQTKQPAAKPATTSKPVGSAKPVTPANGAEGSRVKSATTGTPGEDARMDSAVVANLPVILAVIDMFKVFDGYDCTARLGSALLPH